MAKAKQQNTSGKDNQEARLTALEEQIAHQANVIEEMSGMIAAQWNEIDPLKKKLAVLVKRFVDLEEASAPHHENTKPPHY